MQVVNCPREQILCGPIYPGELANSSEIQGIGFLWKAKRWQM